MSDEKPAPHDANFPLRERIWRIDMLKDLLYDHEGCSTGGPFHIIIDDGNLRDSDLVFTYKRLHDPDCAHLRAIGLALLHELMFLTEAQRWMWHRGRTVEEIVEAEKLVLIHMDSGGYDVFPPEVVEKYTIERKIT